MIVGRRANEFGTFPSPQRERTSSSANALTTRRCALDDCHHVILRLDSVDQFSFPRHRTEGRARVPRFPLVILVCIFLYLKLYVSRDVLGRLRLIVRSLAYGHKTLPATSPMDGRIVWNPRRQ